MGAMRKIADNFELLICALCLLVITVALFSGVIFRYVIRFSLIWVEEIARFALVWLTFIGAAWLSKGRALIRVELILNALHPGSRRILEALIELLGVVFAIYLVVGGFRMVRLTWPMPTPAAKMPMGLFYLPLPLAGLCMIIHSAHHVWKLLRSSSSALGERIS